MTSRSYGEHRPANVLTVFNLILAAFGVVTLVFGDARDALFLGIIVANSTIGISQEIRAKRALDRLSLLVAPHAKVRRDGTVRRVEVEQVVVDDVVVVAPGDQVIADGTVLVAADLRLDESILTGESEPARRAVGQEARSGAFVVEGTDRRVPGHGRRRGQLRGPHHRGGATSAAGVVTMIPEGLMVLVSLTYAAAAVRMSRRGVLAQQLKAIESLASVDTICVDKTGTLTEATLRVVELVPAAGVDEETSARRWRRSPRAPRGAI